MQVITGSTVAAQPTSVSAAQKLITLKRFDEILGAPPSWGIGPQGFNFERYAPCMVDKFRHSRAPGKLRKQAFAPIATVEPTTASVGLNSIDLNRFGKILLAQVPSKPVLIDARTG
jgi:hypothetical protein